MNREKIKVIRYSYMSIFERGLDQTILEAFINELRIFLELEKERIV